MRWLDALGWAKWPSLLLIAAPLAAYPFWLPEPPPARSCGTVMWQGQPFQVHRRSDGGDFVLHPARGSSREAPVLVSADPIGFDAGGMVLDAGHPQLDRLDCRH
jgi:hypothetical protein